MAKSLEKQPYRSLNHHIANRCPCRLCGAHKYTPVFYLEEIEIARCNNCNFVQISRSFQLAELEHYYAKENPDQPGKISVFERQRIVRASKFRARLLKRSTGLRSGKILEVGSSEGHFLSILKAQGFEVLGVEPHPPGARKHQDRGILVINDLLEHADLSHQQFDAICLFQVFEHFEHPRQIAQILSNLLKPEGFLFIEVPDIFSLGAKFEKRPDKLFKQEHISYFSPATLESLLTKAGFSRIHSCHYDYDAFRLPFAKSLQKILVPLFYPRFEGLLDKILQQQVEIHSPPSAAPEVEHSPCQTFPPWRFRKTLRKALTAPLDIPFGLIVYWLNRGANFAWIGKKQG